MINYTFNTQYFKLNGNAFVEFVQQIKNKFYYFIIFNNTFCNKRQLVTRLSVKLLLLLVLF